MAKKKDLGKGIRALLTDIDTSSKRTKKKVVSKLASSVEEIEVTLIETNPFQPRTEFDEEKLQELSSSIKIHGIVQPITVRALGDGNFQLISGERRLRASKLAGKETIPAYIRIANDQEMLEFALIENIQRQDLNSLEVALSYQRLMLECNLTQESLSERVGKKRSTISNYIRLLKLPPQIQQAIKVDNISMGHARVLAGMDDVLLQLDYFKRLTTSKWSVRQFENIVKEEKEKSSRTVQKQKSEEHPEVVKLRKKLSAYLGVSVKINRNNQGKGSINIPFSSDSDFNHLMDSLMN